jgi:hypothetical protein
MFDFCTATDIRNNAWSIVEKFFNDHPEYNLLLKNLDAGITRSACRMIRSPNGLTVRFNAEDEDDFYLAGYVNMKKVPVEKKWKERTPVFVKDRKGRDKLDHYDEVDVVQKTEENIVPEEDVIELGKMIVILLKLKGFDCACEYEGDWCNSRLKEVTINLGGTEDGTS